MNLTPERSRENFKIELMNEKYTDIDDFMTKFFEMVETISKLSESARSYETKINWKDNSPYQEKSHFPPKKFNYMKGEQVEFDECEDREEYTEEEFFYMQQPREKQVCHRMMLYGKCESDSKCNYEHSDARINSEREKFSIGARTRRRKQFAVRSQRDMQPQVCQSLRKGKNSQDTDCKVAQMMFVSSRDYKMKKKVCKGIFWHDCRTL
jgi:hypothetical protein